MTILKFMPQERLKHIESGSHEGIINKITYDEKRNCLWFQISVENIGVLNSSISCDNDSLNSFALNFTNDDGQFVTDYAIGKAITFYVIDITINGVTYSKIVKISLVD